MLEVDELRQVAFHDDESIVCILKKGWARKGVREGMGKQTIGGGKADELLESVS